MTDKDYHRSYYSQHCQAMRDYQRMYYYENRDRLIALKKKRIVCQCGANICYGGINEHYRSKKHKNYIASKQAQGFTKSTDGKIILTFD